MDGRPKQDARDGTSQQNGEVASEQSVVQQADAVQTVLECCAVLCCAALRMIDFAFAAAQGGILTKKTQLRSDTHIVAGHAKTH